VKVDGVSVIVCCHNSVSRVGPTLAHLACQKVTRGKPWEVVLVDNGSTDGTAPYAVESWRDFGSPVALRVVAESTPGLTEARKTGVRAASYENLIFCDDDNWLCDSYVSIAAEVLGTFSSVGVVGGRGEAVYEQEPEDWFRAAGLERGLAVGPQGAAAGDVSDGRGYVYGAGMAIRKSVASRAFSRGFVLSDRKGRSLASGGDCELCYQTLLGGHRIWYEPRMQFKHFVPKVRVSRGYTRRLLFAKGYSRAFLYPYTLVLRKSYLLERNLIWLRILGDRLRNCRSSLTLALSAGLQGDERTQALLRLVNELGVCFGLIRFNYRLDCLARSLLKLDQRTS